MIGVKIRMKGCYTEPQPEHRGPDIYRSVIGHSMMSSIQNQKGQSTNATKHTKEVEHPVLTDSGSSLNH